MNKTLFPVVKVHAVNEQENTFIPGGNILCTLKRVILIILPYPMSFDGSKIVQGNRISYLLNKHKCTSKFKENVN